MEAQEFDQGARASLDEIDEGAEEQVSQHQLALFFKGMVIMEGKQDAKAAIADARSAPEGPQPRVADRQADRA
jgi:hypothetical protein